jgi:hypothetical protein
MAKKATGKSKSGSTGSRQSSSRKGTNVARVSSGSGGRNSKENGFDASEAFVKLLQSPLMAELLAVAATAALAALAEQGFSTGGSRGKRAGNAVKAAGKAAAAAVGRRLGTELDEIRKAATSKGGAKA